MAGLAILSSLVLVLALPARRTMQPPVHLQIQVVEVAPVDTTGDTVLLDATPAEFRVP